MVVCHAQPSMTLRDPVFIASLSPSSPNWTNGLVFEVEMEDAGSPVVDLIGGLNMYQRDGTYTFQSATHKLGSYSLYNAADTAIALTNNATSIKVASGGSLTVTIWCYPSSASAASHPVCRWEVGTTPARSWSVRNDSGTWKSQFSTDGSTTIEVGSVAAAADWTFVCLRFNNDANIGEIRVNNGAFETVAVTLDLYETTGTAAPLSISGRLNNGVSVASLVGYVDQILIFNRAISDAEVDHWYNGGTGTLP